MLSGSIKAALSGAFLSSFGDDTRSMGFMAQRNFNHFLGRRHFKVHGQ
jgi:hypothetical protein